MSPRGILNIRASSVASSPSPSLGGSVASPLRRFGRFSFPWLPLPSLVCWGGGVSFVAHRAQLGRVGGSRWGWVLQIKSPCHKTHPSPPTSRAAQGVAMSEHAVITWPPGRRATSWLISCPSSGRLCDRLAIPPPLSIPRIPGGMPQMEYAAGGVSTQDVGRPRPRSRAARPRA